MASSWAFSLGFCFFAEVRSRAAVAVRMRGMMILKSFIGFIRVG